MPLLCRYYAVKSSVAKPALLQNKIWPTSQKTLPFAPVGPWKQGEQNPLWGKVETVADLVTVDYPGLQFGHFW